MVENTKSAQHQSKISGVQPVNMFDIISRSKLKLSLASQRDGLHRHRSDEWMEKLLLWAMHRLGHRWWYAVAWWRSTRIWHNQRLKVMHYSSPAMPFEDNYHIHSTVRKLLQVRLHWTKSHHEGKILAFNQLEGSWYANFGSDIIQVNLSLIWTMKLRLVHIQTARCSQSCIRGRSFPEVVLRIFKPAVQAIAILAARLLLQSQWVFLLGDIDNSDIIQHVYYWRSNMFSFSSNTIRNENTDL